MSRKERGRLTAMAGMKRQELTLVQAAELMGVGYRQSKRVWKRYQNGVKWCQSMVLAYSSVVIESAHAFHIARLPLPLAIQPLARKRHLSEFAGPAAALSSST